MLSTTLVVESDLESRTITARVDTGDAYLARAGIPAVAFVKIDTEGSEYDVVTGFACSLRASVIEVMQFEYGWAAILTRHLLADHYQFFADVGYDVGKVYPNHVDFRGYDRRVDEDFLGPNFVAVRRGSPARRLLEGRR